MRYHIRKGSPLWWFKYILLAVITLVGTWSWLVILPALIN